MQITVYAWALPLAVTVISAIGFAVWADRENAPGMYSMAVRPFIALPGWIIVSLIAWLIWAVLT